MIDDVSLELISKCPNNCLHCSSLSSMVDKYIFPLDVISDIVEQLLLLSVKRICLSGGEPFLHPDLLKVVEIITKNGIVCDIYSAGVIRDDNGSSSISKNMLVQLKQKNLNRIMFNLQAIDEAKYDLIMGTKGQQQHLFESITNTIQSDIEAEIHFVPMRQNIDQIEKVLTYADRYGIKQVSFLKLVKHGRAVYNELELYRHEEAIVRQKLADLAKSNPKVRIGIPLTYGKVCSCHAIDNKLCIKYDGTVYGCEAFKYINFDNVKASSVYDYPIQSIISNSKYFEKSKRLLCSYKLENDNCPVQNYMLYIKGNI